MLALLFLFLGTDVTDQMWDRAKPTYQKTLEHPFLIELADGTLSKERFESYLIEDMVYLKAYREVLLTLAGKAPNEGWKQFLIKGSADCAKEVEHIHNTYFRGTKYNAKPPSKVNAAYISFLRETVKQGSFSEGLAAVLPCYWIYWEVGRTLKQRGSRNTIYQRWIDYYSDDAYAETVSTIRTMMNTAAKGQPSERLIQIFATGANHEYLFWDSAYYLRR